MPMPPRNGVRDGRRRDRLRLLQGGAGAPGGRKPPTGSAPLKRPQTTPVAPPRRPGTVGAPIRTSEHLEVLRTADAYLVTARDERGRQALRAAATEPALAAAAAATGGAWIEIGDPFALVRTVEEAENRCVSAAVLDYNTGGEPDWND